MCILCLSPFPVYPINFAGETDRTEHHMTTRHSDASRRDELPSNPELGNKEYPSHCDSTLSSGDLVRAIPVVRGCADVALIG